MTSCDYLCDGGWDFEFWDFGDAPRTRAVFGISWTLAVIALCCVFVSVAFGHNHVSLFMFACCVASAATFCFLPIASSKDACERCDVHSQGFYGSSFGTNWGPGTGWYLTICAGVIMLMIWIFGCIFSRRKRSGYKPF